MGVKDLPHRYRVGAHADPEGSVALSSTGVPSLASAPPAEFDGPGDLWSPESLLLAAVTDCFVLTFRALARNSALLWSELDCEAEGVLDRGEGGMRFTEIRLRADLRLPADQNMDRAKRLLERAEKTCPVSNSLATPVHLETRIEAESGRE